VTNFGWVTVGWGPSLGLGGIAMLVVGVGVSLGQSGVVSAVRSGLWMCADGVRWAGGSHGWVSTQSWRSRCRFLRSPS
jgi:hypothetical protein